MASAANRSKVSRHWGAVAAAGGLGFAVGAGGLALLGRDWLVHALAQASAPVAALATGATDPAEDLLKGAPIRDVYFRLNDPMPFVETKLAGLRRRLSLRTESTS